MWTVFHTEASLGWGGQEIRILNESIGMRKRGHEIVILTPAESILYNKAMENNFETISISFKRKDYPKTFFKLLNLLKKHKPDFVNTHSSRDSWIMSAAGRFSAIKPYIVRTRHLSTPIAANMINGLIYKFLPHKIITTGETIRKQLINDNRVTPDKVVSIPTGIDFNLFNAEKTSRSLLKELSLPEDTLLVGMVSVLRSWKGHSYFIEAAELISKENPAVRFIIAGDGPQKENIKRLIKDKKLDDIIFLLGHREDMPGIMSSLDILVHPSYGNEGVPQSLLQGMAMGVTVVSSDLDALKEIVKDGETGLTAPIKNAVVLTEQITKLLVDKEFRKKLGRNGQKLVLQKHSLGKMLDSVEGVYKNILKRL